MAQQKNTASSVPAAVRQLRVLADHADQLDALLEQAGKAEPGIHIQDVIKQFSDHVKLTGNEARQIFFAIDQLSSMAKKLGGLEKAIDRVLEIFGKENLSDLEKKRAQITKSLAAYTEDNPVAISVKAQRLTYLRENMLADAEIITDARPIYNTKGDKIFEFVITHSLVITSNSDDGKTVKIHFSIDAEDILTLFKACERAILKAHTLKQELGPKARILAEDVT
jgi:hypothetical protein